MNDQDLRDAFRALREETSGDSPEAQDTLERVLASSHGTKRRRLRLIKLWVPLAAALVGSSAWAAASGKLDSVWSRAEDAPAPDPAVLAEAPSAVRARGAAPPVAMTVPPSLEPEPSAETETAIEAPRQPAASVSAAPKASAPVDPRSAPARQPSALADDKADYEAAYRAHASATPNDAAAARAAVVAWDRYLSKHPRGRFVPEAKYARAIALARAGSRDEAREALRSFAEGEPGGYRRDDARKLLDAMKK